MQTFSLSANIENGFIDKANYIVTPNASKAIHNIVSDYKQGIHSFTIIGSYGTGKSSFLLALESDLKRSSGAPLLFEKRTLTDKSSFEIKNIVGDYTELSKLFQRSFNIEGNSESVLDAVKTYYERCQKKGKFLIIVIDEFGKILEHAAKNNPERELYFLQKFAEFVNAPNRRILLLTTLHQNFSAYARGLSESQVNEWTKVKGRFKEITFVEPIEQLLHLAAMRLQEDNKKTPESVHTLYDLARETGFMSSDFPLSTAQQLYPLDVFSSFAITSAIQRYGQNERSLFTFLASKGSYSISEFNSKDGLTYNLQKVYDYILYNFYYYLKDSNADAMTWSSMQLAIERVEGQQWDTPEELLQAVNIIKAIGLLNLFGSAGFRLTKEDMSIYAQHAMGISNAEGIITKLEQKKIIRFATYKSRLVLFEGTDVDLEAVIRDASIMVPRPAASADELNLYFNKRISSVKANFYKTGTPRYFDYKILDAPLDITPTGDIDGYVELIFSERKDILNEVKTISENSEHALIFALFVNIEEIITHLHNIKIYDFLVGKTIKKEDRVAISEIVKMKEYEENLLNKAINDNLFSESKKVRWIYKGKEQKIVSQRDFNKLLSKVCDEAYFKTPVMNNELFNRNKLSSTISASRKSYLQHLIENYNEVDLGYPSDKFPPEKSIYYSLLKNTGLHVGEDFAEVPTDEGFKSLWDACEEFLENSVNKARRISELYKILSEQPYKIKQGFLEFWIPTYLFIKRQDYALYDASRGAFIPHVNMEFFDLLQKHPSDFEVKKFAVSGVRVNFFNLYRRFVQLGEEFDITNEKFIETVKPFIAFYTRLNDYTKNTRKFNHKSTMKFRDVLASAKDPEKAFFDDLPSALGFDQEKLKQENAISEYGAILQRAIRELRSCYTELIDRLETRLVEDWGLDSYDYNEYVKEIRQRLSNVKECLLTEKQREFYHHVMTEYDNRTLWYQSICYTILEQRLDTIRDEQEDKLAEDLVYLFRECEKYSSIGGLINDDTTNEAYSFDMVTNKGTNLRARTYILPKKDKKRSLELEKEIEKILSGENNVDICTLLAVLDKKMKG